MEAINKENRLMAYLRSSKEELKKVTWPTRQETFKHTLIVILFSVALALFLGGLDYIFSFLISFIVKS